MVNQAYGSGAFQQLLQAVPCTALVCAATIALLLILLRILAQSLGSQQRRMQEETPRLHPAHFSHLQAREFDPYWNDWMAPTFAKPGPARALDFSSSLNASGFDSFQSSQTMHYNYKSSLTETLSIEVVNPQMCNLLLGFVRN